MTTWFANWKIYEVFQEFTLPYDVEGTSFTYEINLYISKKKWDIEDL